MKFECVAFDLAQILKSIAAESRYGCGLRVTYSQPRCHLFTMALSPIHNAIVTYSQRQCE